MNKKIFEVLKEKVQRGRDLQYAVRAYLDESFEIPEEIKARLEQSREFDEFPTSNRVYLWKENFLKTIGKTPFNANIDEYEEQAKKYIEATSPYCFGIDVNDMMLDSDESMLAEIALYALSIGASDEQVLNLMTCLKDKKCKIPDESIANRYNIKSMDKEFVKIDDVLGTTVEKYQADNLLGTLVKLNDKNIAGFISYLMKSDAIRHPQKVFDGICIDIDKTGMYVSEGNHRLFTYKALQAIREMVLGEKERAPSIEATLFRHINPSQDYDI